jgi:hypothetical protein
VNRRVEDISIPTYIYTAPSSVHRTAPHCGDHTSHLYKTTENKQNLSISSPILCSSEITKLPPSLPQMTSKSRSGSTNSSKKQLLISSTHMASPSSLQIPSPTLEQLDHDHITSVLLLLPFDSILPFAQTCKKFKSLALSESLWELVCRRDWGNGTIDSFLATLSEGERSEFSYRKLYEKVFMVGSLSCRRLVCKGGAYPKQRASHSLNLVSDWLVLFGGGCEGGRYGLFSLFLLF